MEIQNWLQGLFVAGGKRGNGLFRQCGHLLVCGRCRNRRTTLEVQSRKLDFIFSGHSRGNDLFRMLGCLSICRRYGDRTGEVEIQNRVQNPRFKVTQSSWWRILTGLLMASDAQQSYSMLKSKPCVTTGSKLRYTSRHSGEFEVKMNDIRSYRAFLCSARKSRRN